MATLDDVLRQLRGIYLEESRQRALSMTRLIGALEQQPATESEMLTSLAIHFHGFAGTGATYGFEELTLLGRLGELDVTNRQKLGGVCQGEEIRTWKALVAQIEAVAHPQDARIGGLP